MLPLRVIVTFWASVIPLSGGVRARARDAGSRLRFDLPPRLDPLSFDGNTDSEDRGGAVHPVHVPFHARAQARVVEGVLASEIRKYSSGSWRTMLMKRPSSIPARRTLLVCAQAGVGTSDWALWARATPCMLCCSALNPHFFGRERTMLRDDIFNQVRHPWRPRLARPRRR
ncbi:hypothetical protein C8R45DRAFT_1114640 [Mycena sanguinolenta]|nr:hypothetical protein C8R45DRAFT_1114640 [Mycena sanguinolenta]